MAFHELHGNCYLNPHAGGIFQKNSKLRAATSLPSICISSTEGETLHFELHRQQIEAELETITTETLSSSRRSTKYELTVHSSVKYQVSQAAESSHTMARPRSPQKKNEVDHEYLQGLLDEQLSVIRQQLNSLSSERAKMEQKMEDLTNGIKDAREQCAQIPNFIIVSQPGSIRRARSMESRKPSLIKIDTQYNMHRQISQTCASPPLEEVDGEELANDQFANKQFVSMSSIGSSAERRDSDMNSLSDSMNSSSVFSCSVTSLPITSGSRRSRDQFSHPLRPASVSDYLDDHLSPTPIPELPESPGISRSSISSPPHFYATYSPRVRPRSNSSLAHLHVHSPKHRSHSQATPLHLPLSHGRTSTPSLLSPPEYSRPRSGSLNFSASPLLALKAARSSSDLRNRSNSSPSHKKKSPPEIRQKHKDQQLSYFRKNSLTDDSGFKENVLTNTDDECELRGSCDNLSVGSGSATDHDTPTRSNALILRRSSLTGQIEHVSNLRAQVRRNSSFSSPVVEKLKVPLKDRRSLSVSQGSVKNAHDKHRQRVSVPSAPTSSRKTSKVVLLQSKETTV